ncbi:hypothetical protein DFH09DRAFT_1355676 [Mycena vulgaris]|nr:hypothetical protein DFH09DRAFT_1355676 [Mycena vulgaris]
MLRDSRADVRADTLNSLLSLLEYEDIRQFLSTTNAAVEVVHLLDGGSGDANIVRLIHNLISRHTTLLLFGTAVVHETLHRMEDVGAALRESYTGITMMLPPDLAIPSPNVEKLISLLKNPDPAIVKNAVRIVIHFSPSAQFRRILPSTMWEICAHLLRRQDTRTMALEILTTLAKYDGSRGSIILASSGIVHELLNMMKAGTTDFDRWHVGLKGLLALGLF